eukprot:5923628-Prymnesium_polylepis.1
MIAGRLSPSVLHPIGCVRPSIRRRPRALNALRHNEAAGAPLRAANELDHRFHTDARAAPDRP